MLTLILIILFISSMRDSAEARDWEESERRAERRHQEMMDLERELHSDYNSTETQLRRSDSAYVNRKRYLEDPYGNIMAEELTGTYNTDYYSDDYYDNDDEYDDFEDYDDYDLT